MGLAVWIIRWMRRHSTVYRGGIGSWDLFDHDDNDHDDSFLVVLLPLLPLYCIFGHGGLLFNNGVGAWDGKYWNAYMGLGGYPLWENLVWVVQGRINTIVKNHSWFDMI